jgi:exopolyphosphatase/guanosine-5'-triphosphate,3'-diphosphate pyrophosphatase
MTRRVAAIDCGTNSIRLLIADLDAERPVLTDITRQMRIVRLGEGVDRTGQLAPAALDRTMSALRDYAGLIGQLSADAVRMVATSATRDAGNAQEFTSRVKEVLGVAPEVVTGEEEAWLSFTGATRELAGPGATGRDATGRDAAGPGAAGPGAVGSADPAVAPPYLVTDIGGGSTEFVLGDAGQIIAARSVDTGCVRMTERHLHGDPPTQAEVAAATADIDAALDLAAIAIATGAGPAGGARTLVGLAGSVTTVAGIALGLAEYDSARIHHSRVSAGQVRSITTQLLAQTRAQRAAIGVMHPGRVDVIGAGALILARIMTRFCFAGVLVSEHDILDGIAWSLGDR